MTEQREREGHREHRIPNISLSFPILNSETFQIFKVCCITPTFLSLYILYVLYMRGFLLYNFIVNVDKMISISSYLTDCSVHCISHADYVWPCTAAMVSGYGHKGKHSSRQAKNPSLYDVSLGCWWGFCVLSTLPLLLCPISWFCFPVTPCTPLLFHSLSSALCSVSSHLSPLIPVFNSNQCITSLVMQPTENLAGGYR